MTEDNNNKTRHFRVTAIKLLMHQDATEDPGSILAKVYIAGIYTKYLSEEGEEPTTEEGEELTTEKRKIIDPIWKGLYALGSMRHIASLSEDPDKFLECWSYVVTEASAVINSEMNKIADQEKQSNDTSEVETEV